MEERVFATANEFDRLGVGRDRDAIVAGQFEIHLAVNGQADVRLLESAVGFQNINADNASAGNHDRFLGETVRIDRRENERGQARMHHRSAGSERVCGGTRRSRDYEAVRVKRRERFAADVRPEIEKTRDCTL